ncbi:MAG: transposase [Candidatus Zixiibacteriota bacterium]
MVTRRRLELTGAAVAFVTTTVTDFTPVFERHELASVVISQLAETSGAFGVSVIGWVLMPHHLHALLGFSRIQDLSKYMKALKTLSSRKIADLIENPVKNQLTRNGLFRLWMPRFDDVIVNSSKQLEIKLQYIHRNPVKAGLCVEAAQWTHSSARDWLTTTSGPIKIAKNWNWT